MFGNIVYFLY